MLRIQAGAAELFFLNTSAEPDQLRIQLSRTLGAIRESRSASAGISPASPPPSAASVIDEISRLASLHDSGMLTRDEFETLKTRLITGS